MAEVQMPRAGVDNATEPLLGNTTDRYIYINETVHFPPAVTATPLEGLRLSQICVAGLSLIIAAWIIVDGWDATYSLLLPAYLLAFVDFSGVGIAEPILPSIVLQLGGTVSEVGWLNSCYMAGVALGSVASGSLSDSIGRKPVIMFLLSGQVISQTWVAFVQHINTLFLARFVSGFMTGGTGLALAMISDIVTEEQRSKCIAVVAVMNGLGLTLGPNIGGTFASYASNEQHAMLVCSVLSLILLMMCIFMLKETRENGNIWGKCLAEVEELQVSLLPANKVDAHPDREMLAMPTSIFWLALCICLAYTGISMLDASGSIVWMAIFGWDSSELGFWWTCAGLIEILVGMLSPWLMNKMTAKGALIVAASLGCAGLSCFPFESLLVPNVLFAGFVAASFSLTTACSGNIVMDLAPTQLQGTCAGIVEAATSLGTTLAGMVAGALIESPWLHQFFPDGSYSPLCWVFGAICCLLELIILVVAVPSQSTANRALHDSPPAGDDQRPGFKYDNWTSASMILSGMRRAELSSRDIST
eukprot:TRINITY_DN7110_c0_g1_i1.p1 TRINITY_DN7110_c0_g1~~TRINITY_DN7110_c0_g1_i1.p1  ORF type:complete len:599 (+),score=62.90 TRINITY_DN7110_c0_g1_i1:207-1799(+)